MPIWFQRALLGLVLSLPAWSAVLPDDDALRPQRTRLLRRTNRPRPSFVRDDRAEVRLAWSLSLSAELTPRVAESVLSVTGILLVCPPLFPAGAGTIACFGRGPPASA